MASLLASFAAQAASQRSHAIRELLLFLKAKINARQSRAKLDETCILYCTVLHVQ